MGIGMVKYGEGSGAVGMVVLCRGIGCLYKGSSGVCSRTIMYEDVYIYLFVYLSSLLQCINN